MLSHVAHIGPTYASTSRQPRKSIVVYSPDRGFCMSLSMLWRDQFDIVTTTDADMIYSLVQSLQPDLLLAEASPSIRLQRKFEFLKEKMPSLRIVMLCISEMSPPDIPQNFRRLLDAIYTLPVDIEAFEKSVHTMEWQAPC